MLLKKDLYAKGELLPCASLGKNHLLVLSITLYTVILPAMVHILLQHVQYTLIMKSNAVLL